MRTLRLTATPEDIVRAAELLRAGELVAFPTETVYGLGADATNGAAVARIYEAKGRPAHNPLIAHVADEAGARACAAEWPAAAQRLARAFWPGPLTLVVPAAPGLSRVGLAGGDTVGLRAPDHSVALSLLRACGVPLAAPSANISGGLSPVSAEHVLQGLDGRIAAVVDGGACRVGIESTVLDLSRGEPAILRPGAITAAQAAAVIGATVRDAPATGVPAGVLRSPGLLERHYAPKIPLRLVARAELAVAPEGTARIALGDKVNHSLALPRDPEGFASRLYALLWECQDSGAAAIWLERPPETREWAAIHDRLRRAVAE